MRVRRDIRDEELARFLQTADEETLRAAMEEFEADRELVAAIEYGKCHDDPAEWQSVRQFLDSIEGIDEFGNTTEEPPAADD